MLQKEWRHDSTLLKCKNSSAALSQLLENLVTLWRRPMDSESRTIFLALNPIENPIRASGTDSGSHCKLRRGSPCVWVSRNQPSWLIHIWTPNLRKTLVEVWPFCVTDFCYFRVEHWNFVCDDMASKTSQVCPIILAHHWEQPLHIPERTENTILELRIVKSSLWKTMEVVNSDQCHYSLSLPTPLRLWWNFASHRKGAVCFIISAARWASKMNQ